MPEGYAFGRLVEYIEYGNQPQEFGGKPKDPALEYTLGFALWGQQPDPADPSKFLTYHNDDGTPYVVRTYNTAISQNEKSRTHKLFKALNWKGTAKNFAQLLGETYLVKIKHVAKSKTDPKIVSRIDLDGFLPPLDPVSRAPYQIPEAADDLYRLFLWARPTKEAWDSLFIEGQYEAKDGKPAESKNRIQEMILAALDFQGSPLQQLLLESGVQNLPTAAPAAPVAAAPVAAAPVAPAAAPVAAVAPAAPVQVAAPLAQPASPVVSAKPLPASAPVVAPAAPIAGTTTSPSEVAPVAAAAPFAPVDGVAPAVAHVAAVAAPVAPVAAPVAAPVLPV